MRTKHRVLWFGPPGPSRLRLYGIGFAAVALTVWAWHSAVVDRVPAWEVSVRDLHGGTPASIAVRAAGSPAWAGAIQRRFDADGPFLDLPDVMHRPGGDWHVEVVRRGASPALGAEPIRVFVGKRQVLELAPAGRRADATIPVRPGQSTIHVANAAAVEVLHVRNYQVYWEAFPKLGLFHGQSLILKSFVPAPRLLMMMGLLLSATIPVLLYWTLCHPLRIPLFGRRQAIAALAGQAGVMLLVVAVNSGTSYRVLFSPWTAVLVNAVYWLTVSGVFFFRNLWALRLNDFSPTRREGWIEARRAVLVFIVALLVYVSNGRRIGGPETQPPPLMAQSLIRNGDLDLDEYARRFHWQNKPWIRRSIKREHDISVWSPGTGLTAVPFYLAPTWLGLEPGSIDQHAVAKFAGAFMTALSVAFLFLAVRRVASVTGALVVTAGYAFGCSSWTTSSQDLWAHAPAQMGLTIALWAVLGAGRRSGPHWLAATALGLAVMCRPVDAIFALAIVLYAALRYGPFCLTIYLVGALPWAAILLGYNHYYLGGVIPSGYELIPGGGFTDDPMIGFLGLVLSPNRGLLFYSPFVVLAFIGAWGAIRDPDSQWRRLALCLLPALVLSLIVHGMWKSWHGGMSYGCRYAAEGMVFWCMLLALRIDRLLARRGWAIVTAVLLGLSVLFHAAGVYRPITPWNEQATARHGDLARAAWDLKHWQIGHQLFGRD